jgi:primosomal protein N' (replication factor Y)
MGDYHSAETTFQLLCQVAGRAGRAEDKGIVFIQTYNPRHYSIVYAADNDYFSFYNQEIAYRKELNYPPFTNIFSVLFEGEDESLIIQRLNDLLYIMLRYNKDKQFEHLGPVPAVISKINNKYRWRLTVKGKDETRLKNYVLYCLNILKQSKGTNNISINLSLNSSYSL